MIYILVYWNKFNCKYFFVVLQLCLQRKFPSIKDFKAIAIWKPALGLEKRADYYQFHDVELSIIKKELKKPVKSIYAAPNFVEVREFEDIVMIATKVKVSV